MTYTNILYNQTYEKFILRAKQAGIDGLILPDMAIEESKEYVKAAKKVGMDTIFLVSPNTEKDRLKQIIKSTKTGVYLLKKIENDLIIRQIDKDSKIFKI